MHWQLTWAPLWPLLALFCIALVSLRLRHWVDWIRDRRRRRRDPN